MSTTPEADFDLEKLFLPAWAQETPSAIRYAKYTGDEGANRELGDRRGGSRPPRRDGPRPENRGRDRGPQRGPPGGQRGPQGPRPGGPRRDDGRPQRPGGDFRRDDRGPRRGPPDRREAPLPLPEISVALMPDDKGVDSLSRQIKMSGRSFPLFDIAQMILQKPERQQVRFGVKKKPDGQPVQPLFLCALDDTLWLSGDEAVGHVLGKHFATFYQAEKTPTDPPKGTYTFVAQCGMSGIILGPPNYHDYQNQLHRLHTERFSRMPFEAFKARVKIVREEAVVKKWIEEQSSRTEYICLNMAEALKLPNREAVEKHFREVHMANIIKQVDSHTLTGAASRQLRSPGLQRLVRHAWEEQKRFPLQIATVLSQQFASHGLQFFKVNKTVTHVSVARPHYLDMEATPVSDQVKRIVEFINATPKCNRRKLIETLAPTPPAAPVPVAPAAEGAPVAEAPKLPAEPQATPEQASIIGDLHWLIHQGHVIEFANGILETAKKPLPRPPKPPRAEPQPAGAAAAVATSEGQPEAAAQSAEAVVETAEIATATIPAAEPPPMPETPAEPHAETPPEPAAS